MARVSQLFDVLNKLSIAAAITPKNIDERRHAHELLLNLIPCDLVLLDRGCPAFWLFKPILAMEANFRARIDKKWKVVRQFLESGLDEQIVSHSLRIAMHCAQMRPPRPRCRAFRRTADSRRTGVGRCGNPRDIPPRRRTIPAPHLQGILPQAPACGGRLQGDELPAPAEEFFGENRPVDKPGFTCQDISEEFDVIA